MNTRRLSALVTGAFLAGCMTVHAQTVSLGTNKVTLKQAFEKIEKASKYRIVYNATLIDMSRTHSVSKTEGDALDLLKLVLQSADCEYEIDGNYVTVRPKASKNRSKSSNDDKRKVSGKITDAAGDPIIGATVMVKGTTNGAFTDLDGNYVLADVPENAEISISYIGFQPVTLKALDHKLAKIVLQEDSKALSEVVVVGYGTQKRGNLTGAVATISADDIGNRPVTTSAGALQGADPSVNLTFNSGSLDSDYSVDIRGVASINGGTPLVLADGMEVSLNQINPNDIESVSILKDASASSIYGAKASSGVILITTKKGKDMQGKATIMYNGRIGWKRNTTSTDFIRNGYDYVSLVNKFYQSYNNKQWLSYDDEGMQMLLDRRNDKTENPNRPWVMTDNRGRYMYYANFDWYNYFFRQTRPENEHNVSVTGGNDKMNYFVSGRILDQDGIFKIYHDKYHNYSFRGKLSAKLNKLFTYTGNVNFNTTEYKYAGFKDEQQTLYFLSYNLFPNVVPRNPDGTIVQYINQMTGNSPLGGGHAGFLTANEARNRRTNKDLVLTNQLDLEVNKELIFTFSYAYKDRNRVRSYRDMPFEYSRQEGVTQTFTSGTIKDYYQETHVNIRDHNLNIYGTYQHTWDKRHNFKAVGGMQYEDYRSNELSVTKNDLLSKELASMSIATGETVTTQEINAFRTLGYFGRLNYDYMGKYLVEASGRWDGTSRFASHDRWGFFPSASFGWRVSDEKFFEPLHRFWDNAKLRFSLGSLGNQQVDTYAYFDEISTDNSMSYTFDGLNRAYYASVSNPKSANLTWETITTYNLGIDLAFLRNRLTVTADYFIRYTKDMLTHSLTLPAVFGAEAPKANCADLRTNGWELYVGWNDQFKVAGRPLRYHVSATIGDYKSTITKFDNPNKLISDYYEGMTLGDMWGYKVGGLFKSDDEAAQYQARINDKAVNNRVYNSKTDNRLRAGDVKFLDLDGDNVISEGSGTVNNPGDKRIIGNNLPRYSYSFRLGAEYEGIDFSVFFQGVGKQNWYPTQYAYTFWGPYSLPSVSFIPTDFESKVWSEANPDAYFPRPRGNQAYSAGALNVYNDRYLQNAAYLRLKNLSIGYTLPIKNNKILKKARVYVACENLFYWSPMKKYTKAVDPELVNSTSTYQSKSGVGYGFSKSISVGADITF